MNTGFKIVSQYNLGLDGEIFEDREDALSAASAALEVMQTGHSLEALMEHNLITISSVNVHPKGGSKTFDALRHANRTRQFKWAGSEKIDNLFRAVELGEEVGEVLGAVKKLTRAERKIVGNTATKEAIRQNLAEEIGDVAIVLDLLADQVSMDVAECVRMKFNMTSAKHGIPVFIDPDTWMTVDSPKV